MIEPIKIEEVKNVEFSTAPEADISELKRSAELDLDKPLKPQPVALSIGEHSFKGNLYPSTFGSYGDYSCIVGESKARKSFIKSALMAGYVGGQSTNYFDDIRGHDIQDKYILDIDTEQSEYHSQRVFRRSQRWLEVLIRIINAFHLGDIHPMKGLLT